MRLLPFNLARPNDDAYKRDFFLRAPFQLRIRNSRKPFPALVTMNLFGIIKPTAPPPAVTCTAFSRNVV